VWLASALAGGTWVTFQVDVRNDLTSFMPRAATPEERLLVDELRRAPVARLILIALEGAPPEELAAASRSLAGKLRESDLFARISNGEHRVDEEAFQQLFAYRYLLSPTTSAERFSVESLRSALRRRLRELASPLSSLNKQLLPEDPTAELRSMLAAWRGQSRPHTHLGVWFSPDSKRALMVAETRAAGFHMQAQSRTVDTIRGALDPSPHHGVRLVLSGPGAFTVAARNVIRDETVMLAGAAGVVVLLILLASYRSVVLAVLSALPLAAGVLAAIIVVDLLFGGIHAITLAFGVTVIGVAVDYPIHLFSQLHGGERESHSLARVWPTIRLGAITTAMGYLAMTGAEFAGLTQLAVFAVVGLLTAAVSTRFGILPLLPKIREPRPHDRLLELYRCVERPGVVGSALVLALGVAAAVSLAAREASPWQDDVAALSPIPPALIARDRQMRRELGVPDVNHLVVVRGENAESALVASESLTESMGELVHAGVVADFELAARYLPSRAMQRARRDALPSRQRLEADLREALSGLPFRPGVFQPFIDAVAASRDLPPLAPGDLDGTALGSRVAALLIPVEDGWTALVALVGMGDAGAVEAWLAQMPDGDVRYLDLKRDTNRLMERFRQGATIRVLLGIVVIALVLWVGLRSGRRTALVMAPGLLAMLVASAMLLWLGHELTLFHLVSLLLVLGISIDYGLFFTRGDQEAETRARTFHGLCVCALSTISVFAILALSELPVLAAIGATVSLGVAIGFVAAIVLAQHAPASGSGARDTGGRT
jgi:predicted exporter